MTKRLTGERTGYEFWQRHGFVDAECRAFQKMTYEGIRHSVMEKMIDHRRKLVDRAEKGNWSQEKLEARIQAKYIKMGVLQPHGNKILEPGIAGQYDAHDFHQAYKNAYGIIDPKTGKVKKSGDGKIRSLPNVVEDIKGKRNVRRALSQTEAQIADKQFRLSKTSNPNVQHSLRTELNTLMLNKHSLEEQLS